MNSKMKAMLASYARSFLAAGLTAYSLGKHDWQDILVAGLAAVLPVIIRALNPKDAAFGMAATEAEQQVEKVVLATKKK